MEVKKVGSQSKNKTEKKNVKTNEYNSINSQVRKRYNLMSFFIWFSTKVFLFQKKRGQS